MAALVVVLAAALAVAVQRAWRYRKMWVAAVGTLAARGTLRGPDRQIIGSIHGVQSDEDGTLRIVGTVTDPEIAAALRQPPGSYSIADRVPDAIPEAAIAPPPTDADDDRPTLIPGNRPLTDDERLLWQAREALRLTREYVWPTTRLPAVDGWSWWDATRAIDRRLGLGDTRDEMKGR